MTYYYDALMEAVPYPVPWPSVFEAIVSAALLVGVLVLFLRRFGKAYRWLAIILVVLLLDQGAKAAMTGAAMAGEAWLQEDRLPALFGGRIVIGYERNDGMGFDQPSKFLLLGTVTLAVAAMVLYTGLARRRYRMPLSAEVGISLLVGGLLGILVDRVVLGSVVDFVGIDLLGWGHMFYNLADLSAIAAAPMLVLGVVQSWDRVRDGFAQPPPPVPAGDSALSGRH